MTAPGPTPTLPARGRGCPAWTTGPCGTSPTTRAGCGPSTAGSGGGGGQAPRAGRPRPPSAPRASRRLVDAAYSGLSRSGHKDDTILIGETSPGVANGSAIGPVPFVRELYCLNRRYQPYRGRQAKLRGCPTTAASRARFASYHPALFATSGWAHHAYNNFYAPTYHDPDRDVVSIGDIPRLTRTLDRTLRRWGQS